ncbi:MAG: hypothetical protein RLZZ299_1045 [Pseudomonadota bacterium]|jgi:ElaB/YqjD/DUF883 family membrane-anchored ribosome-binding protein
MAEATTAGTTTEQDVLDDLRTVIADAEALLRGSTTDSSDGAGAARARLTERLEAARARLVDAERRLSENARAAAKATDDWVHENPWQAVGIGVGVGLVVGLLVSRR